MTNGTLHAQLNKLLALIREEREYAKSLDMNHLRAVSEEKEQLLRTIGPLGDVDPGNQSLAAQIREENRRNAFLFWSALNWIRESMEFFGRQVAPNVYSPVGNYVSPANANSGRLLSGKV